jgi:MFS family permease
VPARLSLGAGRSAAEGGDRAYLADLTERCPEARGTITGTQQAVQALGLVIGPLIGGRVAEEHGPSSVFYLISLAALFCTAGYSLLPEINAAAEKEEEIALMSMDMSEEEEEAFQAELEEAKKQSDWGTLLRDDTQRVLVVAASANALGFVAKLTCIPWFASEALGATPAQVGELFSLTALLGMASAPLGGVIADKIGLKTVIVLSLLACAIGLGTARDATDVRELQICVGLWGMGTAAAGPAVNALAIESAPKGGEGEALTLPKTAGDLVFLAGPIVIGLTDDALGSAGSSLFLVAGSAAAAAGAAALFLKPPNAKQTNAGLE